jgi:hypothetical protein
MTAARKATAKAEPTDAPQTDEAQPGVPGLDPELARIRDEARAAEPEVKVTPPETPSIDPELVKAREKALEAEKNRKTF